MLPPPTPLPTSGFYTITHDTAPLAVHLEALLEVLPPTTKELLQRWSARVGTIDDMQFKTLDYAVKVLQTHQTDTTTVCPLLEELGNADTTATRILELYDQVHGGLHVFSAGGGRTPSTTSASASSSSVLVGRTKPHGRSANVKKDCRNRDGNRSVLSQFMEEEGLQVAHIIPYSASGEKADMFWPFIEMFLKKDGVTALKGLVLGPQGTTDHLRNVMLLSSTEHQAFDTHKWELVPVLEMLPYNSNTCSEVIPNFPLFHSIIRTPHNAADNPSTKPAWASSARDLLASAANPGFRWHTAQRQHHRWTPRHAHDAQPGEATIPAPTAPAAPQHLLTHHFPAGQRGVPADSDSER